jgi:hypothetical protein
VRHLELGCAVKFIEEQPRDNLERLVVRSTPFTSPGTKLAKAG